MTLSEQLDARLAELMVPPFAGTPFLYDLMLKEEGKLVVIDRGWKGGIHYISLLIYDAKGKLRHVSPLTGYN